MRRQKSKKILVYFFLIIILASINNINLNNFNYYKINKVLITGLKNTENQTILKEIENINFGNIFLLNKNEFNEILKKNSLIENYNVFKKYPSTLNINLKKTNFLAKININGKIYLVGSNGKFSKNNLSNDDLPFIFGKPDIDDFLKFKNDFDNSKFSYNEIKNIFFYRSKRWDIELKNDIVIKLPKENINFALNFVFNFLENKNIKNIKIVDARIKNQIIINE